MGKIFQTVSILGAEDFLEVCLICVRKYKKARVTEILRGRIEG